MSSVASSSNGVASKPRRPMTVPDFMAAKAKGVRLTMLTAYDYTMARLLDEAGVDSILVGDSLGMVVQGEPNSLRVTLDEMIYHTRLVARGVRTSLLVADMPFMTYQISPTQALESAGRLVKEGGAHAVKLEGGRRSIPAIEAIVGADIPIVGHIGLTPQSVHRLGGFRVQRDEANLLKDAVAIEKAGAFALVVECVPATLAEKIRAAVRIPTIGIGAGAHCDAQVLVWTDLMGLTAKPPKLAKVYRNLRQEIADGVSEWARDVASGNFPRQEQSFQ